MKSDFLTRKDIPMGEDEDLEGILILIIFR